MLATVPEWPIPALIQSTVMEALALGRGSRLEVLMRDQDAGKGL